jgi:tetratricopeptide (TPR) repeat protein
MLTRSDLVSLVLSAVLVGSTAAGELDWVGKTVVTKQAKLRLRAAPQGDKRADAPALNFCDYRVLAEKDGRVKLRYHGVEGWLDKNDVVPLDRAVAYFTDRVRANPKDACAFIGRGITADVLGKHDDAIADFDEAVRLNPKEPTVFNNRGIAWGNKGDLDKSIQDFDAALRLDPKYAPALNNRGICRKDKQDFAGARKDYDAAVRLEPRNPRCLENKAWLLATCPDPQFRDGKQAVELARTACELDDGRYPSQFAILAAAYAEAGQFEEAVRWQKKALADAAFVRVHGELARRQLKLYQNKKPFREE